MHVIHSAIIKKHILYTNNIENNLMYFINYYKYIFIFQQFKHITYQKANAYII